MSVLIKGMKMPKSCYVCKMNTHCDECEGISDYCVATGVNMGFPLYGNIDTDKKPYALCDEKTRRLKNCPFVELPDHGDLIDRDELMMKMWGADAYASNQRSCNVRVVFVRDIETAPVVIPAERSE